MASGEGTKVFSRKRNPSAIGWMLAPGRASTPADAEAENWRSLRFSG